MSKKIEKLFKSYRDQLLHLAKLYSVVEIKSYARSSKRLTISQLELLLIKNKIKLPVNRSSDKTIAKHELRENSIRNAYLTIATIFFIGFLIGMRPYIKSIVNEVNFTYVAEEYKSNTIDKTKKIKQKEKKISKKSEKDFEQIIEDQILQIGLPFMGLPGLTVTTDRKEDRPVGVQLVASQFREDILLEAGKIIGQKWEPI